ncbi:LacI family transcriptional regulator [Aquibium sp. A9E412]|uniref:LacI family DNA-binding transcriptional regulator n=1 Tax=Aquibium sp. A9E412 TaxID=2976767 RepID=UPI0025B22899|nr:LacI family DNA-binding transcriptional regulator [Aquibium sp. A9E412]MDN2565762.1 LacI family transcriptional regulator [Aquibium sp. A9E412]
MKEARKRATIRDVATAAGVSVTTVSHVLNGKGRIDPATAERVQLLARQLGYRASAIARGLREGRVGRIAVIHSESSTGTSTLTNLAFFVRMLGSITECAIGQGFSTLLTLPPGSAETGHFDLDGVIFVDPVPENRLLDRLRRADVPIVTTGRDLSRSEEEGNWVDNDLTAATSEMLDLFASRGAERIALVASSPQISYNHDAISSYRAWAERNNRPEILYRIGNAMHESEGFFLARSILNSPDRPDAIHCTTDRHATGLLIGAHAAGIKVPDSLMVSAGTDSIAAQSSSPSLTALDLNPELMGHRACEMLIALIETRQTMPGEVIPHRLIQRDSILTMAAAQARRTAAASKTMSRAVGTGPATES